QPPRPPARRGPGAPRGAPRAERSGPPADRPLALRARRLQLRHVRRPGREVDALPPPQGPARRGADVHRAGRHGARRLAAPRGPGRPLPGPPPRGPLGRAGRRLTRAGRTRTAARRSPLVPPASTGRRTAPAHWSHRNYDLGIPRNRRPPVRPLTG